MDTLWTKAQSVSFLHVNNLLNTVANLIQPDFCSPLVARLVGFHCNTKFKVAYLDSLLNLSFKQSLSECRQHQKKVKYPI